MLENYLICPVCKTHNNISLLIKENNSFKCSLGHNFDLSKEGYLNLLVSKTNCGDLNVQLSSRYSFLYKDFYKPLLIRINELLNNNKAKTVLDCGCGIGYYSKNLSYDFDIIGLDISKEAIKVASKHDKKSFYIVSSSTSIPIQNKTLDAAYVIFAPLFEESIANVLKDDGILIIVTPGKNHLYEIKEILYQNPYFNKEDDVNISMFNKVVTEKLTYKISLTNEDLKNLIYMTPYLYKTSKQSLSRLENIDNITLTIDFAIHLYKKN